MLNENFFINEHTKELKGYGFTAFVEGVAYLQSQGYVIINPLESKKVASQYIAYYDTPEEAQRLIKVSEEEAKQKAIEDAGAPVEDIADLTDDMIELYAKKGFPELRTMAKFYGATGRSMNDVKKALKELREVAQLKRKVAAGESEESEEVVQEEETETTEENQNGAE